MDVNDIRSAVTLTGLVLFVALVLHTWSRQRQGEHAAAAALPFEGDGPEPAAAATAKSSEIEQGERRE
jgi:cbb3-type cytochrome oxidase subunit 3